jgi:hypothetical protein
LSILSVLEIKETIPGVKAAPKDDKEGDGDETKRMPCEGTDGD